jgi:molybdopterin synthase catalytic subunit
MIDIQIKEIALDPGECINFASSPAAGGSTVFIGTVRNATKGKEVVRLEFEAYKPMALKELRKIAETAAERWDVINISIHHRVGILDIEDIAVIIAVTTPHRKAAFEACEYAIDILKQSVPIWKKEIFEDGEVWVASHP